MSRAQFRTSKAIRSFARLNAEARRGLEKVLADGGKALKAKISTAAPRRSGELSSSVFRRTSKKKLSVAVGYGADHGSFVELGTELTEAIPVLRPAAAEYEPVFVRDVVQALRAAASRARVL